MVARNALGKFGTGQGIKARVIRGGVWTLAEFGVGQFLRLLSNLVLTRLLFPEAFGMMAIVQLVIIGLALFSDAGLRGSVLNHARGDEPAFLDTAWSVQIIRGGLLWAMTWALAHPVASLYEEPLLALILPVAGFSLYLTALQPTAVLTADRHLNLGRVTLINLISQSLGLLVLGLLAWQMRSVWALVIGSIATNILKVSAYWLFLPNAHNRFRLERAALLDIFHFGKYIFLSTAAAFLISQGDRAILGLYIPMSDLGVYNVGFFLASVPVLLSKALTSKIVFPLYRMKPISESAANRAAIFRLGRLLALAMLAIAGLLAFIGPALVDFLYDPRYAQAGPMITLYSLSLVPILTLNAVSTMLPGLGDSRRLFIVQSTTAILQVGLLFLGIQFAGVVGAILAPGLAVLLGYPLRYFFARYHNAWDPVQDIALTLFGFVLCGTACLLHADAILQLLP